MKIKTSKHTELKHNNGALLNLKLDGNKTFLSAVAVNFQNSGLTTRQRAHCFPVGKNFLLRPTKPFRFGVRVNF